MFELWIPITIVAAFLQCVRTALQKKLKTELSTNGANFVRYLYGAPIAAAGLLLLLAGQGAAFPALNPPFLAWCLVGGIAQAIATSLLIHAFTMRNFAVGTTYSKTESIQTAVLGVILLGDLLTATGWIAIVISCAGVILLSYAGRAGGLKVLLTGLGEPSARVGIASGFFFGISAVGIRAAALSIEEGDFLLRALTTLATVTLMQTVLMGAYLAWREPGQIRAALATWRSSSLVGILSVIGSACWFSAMTLQNAAYVRALGQIELVFTFAASHRMFGEKTTARELAGIALVIGGVVLLLVGGR